MTEESKTKPNYSDAQDNREYENQFGQTAYMPTQYDNRGYTDSFYDEYEESGAGSFLFGAIVGGVIGAATALFLAPKTGKEMRDDLSTQAVQLKDKGIEIGAVAKDKATEFTSVAKDKATEFTSVAREKTDEFTAVAKEKTDVVTKSLQEQSGQLVEKVKSMRSKISIPMDDGTAFSEGEEATDFIKRSDTEADHDVTATAEALKEAVVGNKEN